MRQRGGARHRQTRLSGGVGTIASGVAKAGAKGILISGGEGGTGAAPMSSVHHAGLPWEIGLAEAHQVLCRNDLRQCVTLETDGKLMSGHDVAVALLLGAEEFGFAHRALVAPGLPHDASATWERAPSASPRRIQNCANASSASRNTWNDSCSSSPDSCARSWRGWARAP